MSKTTLEDIQTYLEELQIFEGITTIEEVYEIIQNELNASEN